MVMEGGGAKKLIAMGMATQRQGMFARARVNACLQTTVNAMLATLGLIAHCTNVLTNSKLMAMSALATAHAFPLTSALARPDGQEQIVPFQIVTGKKLMLLAFVVETGCVLNQTNANAFKTAQ